MKRIRRYADTLQEELTVDHLLFGLIILTGLSVYLPGLGELPLRRWDEALYANSARHMIQEGYWLAPHTQASLGTSDLSLTPRIYKPPLMYWLQAVAMVVFGINEFAARFPSALAAIGTACLVYVIGRDIDDRWTGVASAFILLVLPPVYHGSHAGRTAESDMLLVFFGSLFVWLTWRARRDSSLLVPAGIAAGLAVLTKGFAAGIFVIVLSPVLLTHWPSYLSMRGVRAAATTSIIALPWPLYIWFQYGDKFVEQFVFRAVVTRVVGDGVGGSITPLFEFMNYPYFRSIEWYFSNPPVRDLFLLLLLAGTVVMAYSAVATSGSVRELATESEPLFLLWWIVIVPVGFAVLGGNHQWYILPMVVPAALIIGRLLRVMTREANRYTSQYINRELLSFRRYLLIGVMCVVVLALIYPPVGVGTADREQEVMGEIINNNTSPEMTVYIQAYNRTISGERLQVFSFYARQPLDSADIREINTERHIRYALVESKSLPQIDREYSVLFNASKNGIHAIKLSNQTTDFAD